MEIKGSNILISACVCVLLYLACSQIIHTNWSFSGAIPVISTLSLVIVVLYTVMNILMLVLEVDYKQKSFYVMYTKTPKVFHYFPSIFLFIIIFKVIFKIGKWLDRNLTIKINDNGN